MTWIHLTRGDRESPNRSLAATSAAPFLGCLIAISCGRTDVPTDSGFENGTGGANGNEGGTRASGGASGVSGSSGASGGAEASGGTSGVSGGSGASGTAGASSGGAGGMTAADAGQPCRLPVIPPPLDPTPEELERDRLIHDYCANVIRQDCLDPHGSRGVSDQTLGCSTEQRIMGCQQDVLFDHLEGPLPECDEAWRALIRCKAQATFDPSCNGASLNGGEIPPKVCPQEVLALLACGRANSTPSTEIKGTRTTCSIYTSGPGVSAGECSVGCGYHLNSFGSRCSISEPRRCDCVVNAHILGGGAWSDQAFYEGSCEQTAKAMADGEWCTNHLDCCLEYVKDGVKRCDCGAEAGCEEARQALGATRVDRCAKYNSL
jgi:hypothetical protein